jgi:hypothetical protein
LAQGFVLIRYLDLNGVQKSEVGHMEGSAFLGLKNWDGFDFSSDTGFLSINQLQYKSNLHISLSPEHNLQF